jgi:hypothetical protein
MKVSRAPEAELNLLAALTAAPALAGVSIDGRPVTDNNWAEQNVYLDDTEFNGDWRGATKDAGRNDDFTISVVVIVRKIAAPSVVKARAWELALAIGDVIYADTYLGGVLNIAAEVSTGTVTVSPAGLEGEWQGMARLSVHGEAVITP